MFQRDGNAGPFSFRRSGTIGQEILDSDGNVICWTTSERLAALIVHLLNEAHAAGLAI